MDLSAIQLAAISEWAESRGIVTGVHLFGSRARGEAQAESDADIAVEIDPTLDPRSKYKEPRAQFGTVFYTWEVEIGRAIGLQVDLWLLHPILMPDVRAAVARDGILLWQRRS